MALKNKIYLAVIATGLVALALDRCYFRASAPASTAASEIDPATNEEDAESSSAPRSRPVVQPSSIAPVSKLSVPELHFPRNLPVYDPAVEMRDVFSRLEREDSIKRNSGKSGSAKNGAEADSIGREAFQAAHRIDAVLVQESLKIAVVDGRWMRVGDTVDHCTLTKIEGDSVVFQCHDGDTVLVPSGKRRHSPG